jgi:hypothetical protein
MIFKHAILIFDTYLNADGEDVFYLAFTCDPQKRAIIKYEQTESIFIGGEVTKRETWNEKINIDFVKNTAKENEESITECYKKYGDSLSYEEKKMELDLLKMIKCYEKSYGRYFIDSAEEWRNQDKLRKLQIESDKEMQKVIKEQKEKDRKQKEKEELIQKTDFHNNLKEKELPKRFFENKSTDYSRTDFIRPNHDKSNYSVSSFSSYNNDNNNTNIIKDNSLLKKINKINKIPLEENININNKPETIIIPDVDVDVDVDSNNNIIKKKSKYIIIPDDKEDDVFNNSGKRRREESNSNSNINIISKRKIDISDDNNNNNNNQTPITLFDYSNLVLSSNNPVSSLIKLYKRGNVYKQTECLYDKDNHPVIQFKNPEGEFSKSVQIQFKEKLITQNFFNTIQNIGNMYNEKDQMHLLFALGKPIKEKGVYFCGVVKYIRKLEYLEVKDEIDSSKVINHNNNNTFIIVHIINNYFNILMY